MKMVWILILAALMLAPVSAQETVAPVEPSPALLTYLADLEADTTEIRGLAPLEPVERYFPNKADIAAFLAGQFADEIVRQSVIDAEFIYKAFGLLEPDVDLLGVYQPLLEAQVAGYYDPATKRMNTLLISTDKLSDKLPLFEQILYVHEFTHALQDQHFDLDLLLNDEMAAAEPDRAVAIQALIEGDATQTMTDYVTILTQENPTEVLGQLDALMGSSASAEIPAGTPDILTQELLFPYTQGQVFVQALIAQGGYAAVDAAFRNPPVSSEQVIHPDKYLAGEMPIAVDLTDSAGILGDGWALAYDHTAGEYFLRNWLRPGLSAFTLPIAASGWGGDRYLMYANAEGQAAYQWKLVFDTAEDEAQFLEYLPKSLTYQFGDPTVDGACWDVGGGEYALCYRAQTGGGVMITRAPNIASATALLG